uniref:Uncharacterized protein n=1 Tax=Terrapene triunguis TaxID=2587831 RepID=A0A674KCJ9_9SAUR
MGRGPGLLIIARGSFDGGGGCHLALLWLLFPCMALGATWACYSPGERRDSLSLSQPQREAGPTPITAPARGPIRPSQQ